MPQNSDAQLLNQAADRGLISWFIRNPVAANLIMVFCLIGGFLMLGKITQEVFPDTTIDIVRVDVSYPGASPEEVEQGLLLVVEEAVRGLDGVAEVSSTARESGGSVSVELLQGQDLQKLADDVKSEVDRIGTFPQDAEEPEISIVSRRRNVIDLVLYGTVFRKSTCHVRAFSLHQKPQYHRLQGPRPGSRSACP